MHPDASCPPRARPRPARYVARRRAGCSRRRRHARLRRPRGLLLQRGGFADLLRRRHALLPLAQVLSRPGGRRLRPAADPGRLLGRHYQRCAGQPAGAAGLDHGLRHPDRRRQRRRVPLGAVGVRQAGLDEQLQRRDPLGQAGDDHRAARPGFHRAGQDPQQRAVGHSGAGRLSAPVRRPGLQRRHLLLPDRGVPAQRGHRPAGRPAAEPGGGRRRHLRRHRAALHRPRGLRPGRVDQRPLVPDGELLPPQGGGLPGVRGAGCPGAAGRPGTPGGGGNDRGHVRPAAARDHVGRPVRLHPARPLHPAGDPGRTSGGHHRRRAAAPAGGRPGRGRQRHAGAAGPPDRDRCHRPRHR